MSTIDVIELMKQKLPDYVVKCLLSAGYDEIEVLSTMDTSEKQGNSIEKIESFIEKKHADNSEHDPFLSHPFEFPPGHRIRMSNFIRELNKLRRKLSPVKPCVAQKRLHSHMHSNSGSSTTKRMKVVSANDTDNDDNEVLTALQVSKQVRSCMKKWIKKQDDTFLGQLCEDEHYSLFVKPNEKGSGSFSVSVRCMACGKSIMLPQKGVSTYVVSNWYRHAKLCFTKARSGERLTQLAIHKCLPKSSHSSAMAKNTHGTVSSTAINPIDLSESEKSMSPASSPALDTSSHSMENEISSDNQVF